MRVLVRLFSILFISRFVWGVCKRTKKSLVSNEVSALSGWMAVLVGFILSLVIMICVSLFNQEVDSFKGTEQLTHDITMQLLADDAIEMGQHDRQAFIDINNDVHISWGSPYITPRDKLLDLIKASEQRHANTIIIDFDLSRLSHGDVLSDEDANLLNYLHHLDLAESGTVPAIILIQTFRGINNSVIPKIRQSFMSQYPSLFDNQGNVFWASSMMPIDDDYTIRNYQLFEVAEGHKGSLKVFPSASLLAAMIHQEYLAYGMKRAVKKTHAFILEAQKGIGQYTADKNLRKNLMPSIVAKVKVLDIDNNYITEKVVFKNPQAAGVEVISANAPILQNDPNRPFDPEYFKDRIVIIGASHNESFDIHNTPIGEMAGALIIANSIATLEQYGSIKLLSWQEQAVLIILIALLMSLVFLVNISWVAIAGVSLFFLIAVFPIGLLLYAQGIWMNIGLLVISVQLVDIAVGVARNLVDNRKKLKLVRLKLVAIIKREFVELTKERV